MAFPAQMQHVLRLVVAATSMQAISFGHSQLFQRVSVLNYPPLYLLVLDPHVKTPFVTPKALAVTSTQLLMTLPVSLSVKRSVLAWIRARTLEMAPAAKPLNAAAHVSILQMT